MLPNGSSVVFLEKDSTAIQDLISAFKIDWIMLTIVGFYYSGGAFEGIINKKSHRFQAF